QRRGIPMAVFATCGAQVEGRFCAKCGTSVAAGAPPPSASPAGPVYSAPDASAMADNVAGALCYSLGLITGILFLVLAPYNQNPKIRFHAFQSIFYCVFAIALGFVFGFIAILSGGWTLFLLPIFWLIRIGLFVLWLVLLIKAYQDQKLVLPI